MEIKLGWKQRILSASAQHSQPGERERLTNLLTEFYSVLLGHRNYIEMTKKLGDIMRPDTV